MMRFVSLCVLVIGCEPAAPSFLCSNDQQCGAGGACEPTGFCSFADPGCASGRRYDAHAGALSEICVDTPGIELAAIGFLFDRSLVDETSGEHRIAVGIPRPSELAIAVEIDVVGGSAGATDFTFVESRIEIPPGATRGELVLEIAADAAAESDETIELALVRPTNATIASGEHVATIAATALPRVQLASPASSVGEAAGTTTLTVLLDSPSETDVVAGLAVSGSASPADYDIATDTITIPAGKTTATITLSITSDAFDEDPETLDIVLGATTGAVVGAIASHRITIEDDDPLPSVAFEPAGTSVAEGGIVTLALALSAPSGRTVTVPLSVAGTVVAKDFQLELTVVTFAPGVVRREVRLSIVDDTADDDNERIEVRIGTPTNAIVATPNVHAVTIVDNDPAPTVRFSASTSSVLDILGDHTVLVLLSAEANYPITFSLEAVDGTATSADYTVPTGPFTIPPGFIGYNVPVSVVDDDDPDETFSLRIASPSTSAGNPSTHIVTIEGF